MIKKVLRLIILLTVVANNGQGQDIFKNRAQEQAAFRLILSDELAAIYDHIFDPTLKADWETKYWKVVDPTPTTETNEIYDQFRSRFQVAQRQYANLVAPLFLDDRGKYYLKYGAPDEQVVSSGLGKSYQDNETWAYYRFNLYVDFVDQPGYGFREVMNLLEAVSRGPANQKIFIAASLYTERERLHQKYLSFREIADGRAGIAAGSRFYQIANDLGNEKKLALEAAPRSYFDFSFQQERLEAQMSSTIFRGEGKLSRVECYYSFPLNQLQFQTGAQGRLESLVEMQITFFDHNFDRILQRQERLMIIAANDDEVRRRIYLNQHTEELPAGIYQVVLQLESQASQRLAILRGQLQVRDFSGDSLLLSDIQLSPQIKEGAFDQRHAKPNGILVVPYIGNAIRRTNPIYIYFEIYHLAVNQQGQTRFQISYQVQSVSATETSPLTSAIKFISHMIGKKSEEKIGSSFESEGQSTFQQVYLQIDFAKFPPGSCLLTITVTDLESGASISGMKRLVLK